MFIAGLRPSKFLRSPGDNGGSAGENTDPKPGEEGNAGSGGGNGSGDPGKQEPKPELKFTQTDVDGLLARTRDEERRKYEKKITDAQAEAERKKAIEQGEFQRLYEAEQSKTAELAAKAEAAERYATRIHASIDAEIKEWPEEVVKGDPGKENVDARLKWVEDMRALATRLNALSKSPNMEHGAGARKPNNNSNNPLAQHYRRFAVPGQKRA